MNIKTTSSVLRIFLSSIKNIVAVCHSALRDTLTAGINIPLSIRYKLTSAEKCTVHINRILQIFDGILDSESLSFHSYNPGQLLEGLASAFTDTVSDYSDVSVNVYSRLKFDYALMTNKDLLELTILNLLYVSLRNADTCGNKKLRFHLYLSGSRHNITIHIRDNCNPINPEIIDSILSGIPVESDDSHPFGPVISFSLMLAKLSTSELKGKFDYRALKSGNRFDIILPKLPQPIKSGFARSPRTYSPNIYYFKRIFADLFDEEILTKSDLPRE